MMKRRSLLTSLFGASVSAGVAAHVAVGSKKAPHIVTTTPGLTTTSYYVSNPAAFPSLPFPTGALIFRNGVYQTVGEDYDCSAGVFTFRWYNGASLLSVGDKIAVVTPGTPLAVAPSEVLADLSAQHVSSGSIKLYRSRPSDAQLFDPKGPDVQISHIPQYRQ